MKTYGQFSEDVGRLMSKLKKGGLETAVYTAGSVVVDRAAKALAPHFAKGLANVTGYGKEMERSFPTLYGKYGPDSPKSNKYYYDYLRYHRNK